MARSCAFVPGTQDLGSEWIKPKRKTLLRTGDVRLRARTALPSPPHALPQRRCRGSSGPRAPSHPLSNGSAVLRIQGHYIWLQSSFMRLLGC